jgi:hypothetical protein
MTSYCAKCKRVVTVTVTPRRGDRPQQRCGVCGRTWPYGKAQR